MKKLLPILILLSIIFLISCQERGQPVKYCYSFSIVDSFGQNLIGDTINLRRYRADSIGFYALDGTQRTNYPYLTNGVDGYICGAFTTTNSNDKFIIKYNANISLNDTINVIYGNRNVNIYKSNQLLFNKNNISQTTEIHFDIIK